jgi:hypothetical protein
MKSSPERSDTGRSASPAGSAQDAPEPTSGSGVLLRHHDSPSLSNSPALGSEFGDRRPTRLTSSLSGTESLRTLCWREMDSKFWFHVRCNRGLRGKSSASAACRRPSSAPAVGGHQLSRKPEPTPYRAGTGISNPSPSSGESGTNRARANERAVVRLCATEAVWAISFQ